MGKGQVGKRSERSQYSKVKKNISRKEAEKLRRKKQGQRLEKIKIKKAKKERDDKINKLLKKKEQGVREESKGEDEWEDVDEHERDAFDKDGYFDVPDHSQQISQSDEALLAKLQKFSNKQKQQKKQKKKQEDEDDISEEEEEEEKGVSLADLIMQKLSMGDYAVAGDSKKDLLNKEKLVKERNYEELEEGLAKRMDPKVVATFRSLGQFLQTYKSGKVPKAFTLVPRLANWEDMLFLTRPEKWSLQAHYQATKIFVSNMNEKMVQRFYSLVLLPAVRENIQTYKKLNYHLYISLKKALFKPAAFFKGFLLPIAEDASSREALIIGSVLQKMSVPVLHASAALIKLTELDYGIGSGYFLKVLLGKKFHFPSKVLEVLVQFFCDFDQEQEMPVIWHQSLLLLVANYKHFLTDEHREQLRELLKCQQHYLITPEIRRELFSSNNQMELDN